MPHSPGDLAIPPGDTPLDNDLARFDYAIQSIDRERDALNRIQAWAEANCTS